MTAVPDYFAVLQVPVSCEVDLAALEQHYRQLQAQWHPDRKAGAPEQERLEAIQRTSLLNDAYTTLKTPLLRAAHLLLLRGIDVGVYTQSQLEPAFLLSQMELRDELDDTIAAGNIQSLDGLNERVGEELEQHWQGFSQSLAAGELEQAQRTYYKMQFLQRLREEIRAAEDRLLGY